MSEANRYVDLWLSDFTNDPHEVASVFPQAPLRVARKGEPTGKSRRPARRNLIIFRHEFQYETTWTQAIEALVSSLGGWSRMADLLAVLHDGERLIQLTLPIHNSPHQENNYLEAKTLERLAQHGIDLGMEFSTYPSSENPT